MTMTLTRLADELKISTAQASRLAKRGMPTGSVEAANAWRTANLNPSWMKPWAQRPGNDGAGASRSLDQVAVEADQALQRGAFHLVEGPLRTTLRGMHGSSCPRFTWPVWVALTRHFMHLDFAPDAHRVEGQLSADEFALIVSRVPNWGAVWLDAACDWDQEAGTGRPEGH